MFIGQVIIIAPADAWLDHFNAIYHDKINRALIFYSSTMMFMLRWYSSQHCLIKTVTKFAAMDTVLFPLIYSDVPALLGMHDDARWCRLWSQTVSISGGGGWVARARPWRCGWVRGGGRALDRASLHARAALHLLLQYVQVSLLFGFSTKYKIRVKFNIVHSSKGWLVKYSTYYLELYVYLSSPPCHLAEAVPAVSMFHLNPSSPTNWSMLGHTIIYL